MSPRSLSYTFPAGNATDVCLLQTLAAAGSLTLNGNLVNKVNGVMSFANKGYSRSISLTSVNNLSGVNFTITGVQNNVVISETIAGPNNNTVYGAFIYDTITSITTNGAAAAVSVGSGWKGFFPLIQVNLWPEVINYNLSVTNIVVNNAPQIAVFGTLDNLVNNGVPYLTSITLPSIFTIVAMGANAPYGYSSNGNETYSQLLIQIGQSSATVSYAIKMDFLQI